MSNTEHFLLLCTLICEAWDDCESFCCFDFWGTCRQLRLTNLQLPLDTLNFMRTETIWQPCLVAAKLD